LKLENFFDVKVIIEWNKITIQLRGLIFSLIEKENASNYFAFLIGLRKYDFKI
jgi:hypothetical protein